MKVIYTRNNFTGGVIDPRLVGRADLQQWQNGLLTGENIVPIPQGGVKRRWGTKFIDDVLYLLERITANITISAPNGGTTANANDGNESTLFTTATPIGTTDPYEVVKYFRSPVGAKANIVDVVGIRLDAGSSTEFCIQTSPDDIVWTTQHELALVDTTPRTYRFLTTNTTAVYWRVARVGSTDLTTSVCTLEEFNLWSFDTLEVSDSRLIGFEFNDTQEYILVLTERNIRVFNAATGAYLADVRTPYLEADLQSIDYTQSADTMILVHENYAPQRLLRAADDVWYLDDLSFSTVPQYDYNDASSPTPTAHEFTLTFAGGAWDDGDRFKVIIDGAVTEDIVFAGDTGGEQTTTAENIRRAIQALPTVGLSGVSVSRTGAIVHTVVLAEDSAKDYTDLVSAYPISGSSSNRITVAHTVTGVPRTEDVWSATRGYPKTTTFHEGRLYFFGTRSLPQALFGSVANDFFNFEVGKGLDDEAIFVVLNTDQLNAARAIFSGRSLQLFTGGAEYFIPDSPITPGLTIKQQTRYGSIARKPVTIDGATLYLQKSGKVLREFVFSFDEDAYIAPPLSILAPHLLSDARSIAVWEGDGQDDANLAFIVNGDGTMAVLNTLRAQNINAWCKWTTDGLFKDVCVVDERVFVTVDREINGVAVTYLEQFDASYYTDCAVVDTVGGSGGVFATHLAGESVDVRLSRRALYADGDGTKYQVSGAGLLTIDTEYAGEEVEVGLPYTPTFALLSPGGATEAGDYWAKKKRAVRVVVYCYEALGLQVYDGRETRVIPNFVLNETPLGGDPELETGFRELSLTTGWAREILLRFSQPAPLPMTILAVEVDVEVGDR